MSKLAIILALAILTLYLVYVVGRYGWKQSISASFYETGWLFQSTLMAVAILVIVGTQSNLFVIAGVLLQAVGVYPNFKDKREAILHSIGAYGSGLFSLIGIYIYYNQTLAIGIAILTLLARLFVKKNTTYWVEVILFFNVLIILSIFV